jgi:hypothetical protein
VCFGPPRQSDAELERNTTRAPHGVRPLLADAIREEISAEYLRELVSQVKVMSKGVFAYCPDCGRSVQVTVPDLPRIIAAVSELLEQAEGKPGTVATEDAGVTLIVERSWPAQRSPDPPPASSEPGSPSGAPGPAA